MEVAQDTLLVRVGSWLCLGDPPHKGARLPGPSAGVRASSAPAASGPGPLLSPVTLIPAEVTLCESRLHRRFGEHGVLWTSSGTDPAGRNCLSFQLSPER